MFVLALPGLFFYPGSKGLFLADHGFFTPKRRRLPGKWLISARVRTEERV